MIFPLRFLKLFPKFLPIGIQFVQVTFISTSILHFSSTLTANDFFITSLEVFDAELVSIAKPQLQSFLFPITSLRFNGVGAEVIFQVEIFHLEVV